MSEQGSGQSPRNGGQPPPRGERNTRPSTPHGTLAAWAEGVACDEPDKAKDGQRIQQAIQMRTSVLKPRILVFYILFVSILWWLDSAAPPKWTSAEDATSSSPETMVMANRTVWEDLDLSSTVSCGRHKCFVRSASDQKEGYIIALPEKDALSGMMNEAKLAKEMALSYDAKTFHIAGELPQELLMPEKTMAEINARVRDPLKVYYGGNDTEHGFFTRPLVPVVVQKMKACPKDSLLVHCANNDFTKGQLPAFIPNVVDDSLFRANIARDRYMMYKMLVGMPQLATDFQFLINTSGELYFIDFGGHAALTSAMVKFLGAPLSKIREQGLCGESFNMINDALDHRNAGGVEDGKE